MNKLIAAVIASSFAFGAYAAQPTGAASAETSVSAPKKATVAKKPVKKHKRTVRHAKMA